MSISTVRTKTFCDPDMLCGPDAEIYSVWLQGSSVFISIFNNMTIPGQSFTYAGENSFYYTFFSDMFALLFWEWVCCHHCLVQVVYEHLLRPRLF